LFCGYLNWHRALRVQHLADSAPVPRALYPAGLAALRLAGKQESLPYDWLARAAAGRPIFWGGAEALPHVTRQTLLSPRFREKYGKSTSWEAIKPIWQRFSQYGDRSRLHWMTYLDLNYRIPELLLMRVDKMSMGVGLEGRVPFLDHRFVELSLSINERTLTRGGIPKAVLRRAVRGLIPDEIIDRPKQGFGVPVHEWMLDDLGDYARDAVEVFSKETDFLDGNEAKRMMREGRPHHRWTVLNLAMWWREYIQ
jgi:asparagine synthase (glutamine-hydrolysing)